tara:strand:- start:1024 stop:1695 length:672 start_codon:yes stop_codon:yes gene_type:complete
MNREEVIEKLREIGQSGLSPSAAEYREGDDGHLGRQLESMLGVVENNSNGADCPEAGLELKTKKKGSTSPTSLFTQEPTWVHPDFPDIRSAVQKLKNEDGRMNLVMTSEPNVHGLWLDWYNEKLVVRYKGAPLCEWTMERLKKPFEGKLESVALVIGDSDGATTTLYEGFSQEKFKKALKDGKVRVEFRAGDYNGKKKFKNRGTVFRMMEKDLAGVYTTTTEI